MRAIDEAGRGVFFADYAQWEVWQQERLQIAKGDSEKDSRNMSDKRPIRVKRKLSYLEAREYATLEERIKKAEHELRAQKTLLEDPAIASDAPRLVAAQEDVESTEKLLDSLLNRWTELAEKQS